MAEPEKQETPKSRIESITDLLKQARENTSSAVDVPGQLTSLKDALTDFEQQQPSEKNDFTDALNALSTEVSYLIDQKIIEASSIQETINNIRSGLTELRAEVSEYATGKNASEFFVPVESAKPKESESESAFVQFFSGMKNKATGAFGSVLSFFNMGEKKSSVGGTFVLKAQLLAANLLPFGSKIPGFEDYKNGLALQIAHRDAVYKVESVVAAKNATLPPEQRLAVDLASFDSFEALFDAASVKGIGKLALSVTENRRQYEGQPIRWAELATIKDVSPQTSTQEQNGKKNEQTEASTALPSAPVGIAALEAGVEFGEFGVLFITKNPAAISVDGRVWKMKGKAWTKEALATFSIKNADWNGSSLSVSVTGNAFGFTGGESGTIDSQKVRAFLQHLKTSSDPFTLPKSNGKPSNVELILS